MKDFLMSIVRSFVCALCAAALGALSIALMLALYDIPRTVELDVACWALLLLALALISEVLARREASMLVTLIACCAALYFGGEQVVARTVFLPGSSGFPVFLHICIWSSGAACAYACNKEPGSNAFVRLSDVLIMSIGGYMATLYALNEALNAPILAFSLAALLLSMLVTAALRAGGESDSVIRGAGMGGYLVIGALLLFCLLLAALLLSLSSDHVNSLVDAFLVVWSFVSKLAMQLMTILGLCLAFLFGGQRMMQTQYAAQNDSIAYQVGAMEAMETAPQWVVYLVMGVIGALILAVVLVILWALRTARFGRARKKKIRRRVTRTSKAGEALRALMAKAAGAIAFELSYRTHRRTPQGLYVLAVRMGRIKRLPKRKSESGGAYLRRLHTIALEQQRVSTLDRLADMLDLALYSTAKPHLSRGEADAMAAQIRAISPPPLIRANQHSADTQP